MPTNSQLIAVPRPLVLASRSAIRARLLREAGVAFETVPGGVDEAAVKAAMAAEAAAPHDVADALAEMKAHRGGTRRPEALALGADQVLACDGRLFDKPVSLDEAAVHLRALRGRRHELLSAAVIVEDGRPVWRHIGRVRLEMRAFSDAFLQTYLDAEGEALLETVGAYRLEGLGAQLFSRVDGDYFSVLGLPLLELLHVLRGRGVVAE